MCSHEGAAIVQFSKVEVYWHLRWSGVVLQLGEATFHDLLIFGNLFEVSDAARVV